MTGQLWLYSSLNQSSDCWNEVDSLMSKSEVIIRWNFTDLIKSMVQCLDIGLMAQVWWILTRIAVVASYALFQFWLNQSDINRTWVSELGAFWGNAPKSFNYAPKFFLPNHLLIYLCENDLKYKISVKNILLYAPPKFSVAPKTLVSLYRPVLNTEYTADVFDPEYFLIQIDQ